MKLLFERSRSGRAMQYLPDCDVPEVTFDESLLRGTAPRLPELSEVDLDRHYTALSKETYGVNTGFYPLGSCTMKYNPRINEAMASLPGFAELHPLQDPSTAQGSLELLHTAGRYLCEITGMDDMTFQPAAGAHGEYTGLLLIRRYHELRGDLEKRTKILVPDSAHGTNPASAVMAGFTVVSVPSNSEGGVDLEALRAAAGEDTAGLMLTNPNTLGLFDPNILEITKIVHDAGGLCYYDGANLNAVMGHARPGDMGFDCVHVNLHKTFSTPHGGGGPGSGPVGCKAFLSDYLPSPQVREENGVYSLYDPSQSVGKVRSFQGNFLVVVRAFTYLLSLGGEGLTEASSTAVLNANYMMHRLSSVYEIAYPGICMHEFVMDLKKLKDETGVSAMDVAKRLLDFGIHPPTMYFPLIVHEALMLEPTETESRETLDAACDLFLAIAKEAKENPEILHSAPNTRTVGRPDEVTAARNPVLRYPFE
ncbi:MAG: aminomethyl-transferring glycine dehydrogenase subunit GcvPB [Oscillospiraceae bacterium]|nr:aminomethyl-transferring glycine dehydrogenase subunit GcvPB [Oscillospiraceae bacterium]